MSNDFFTPEEPVKVLASFTLEVCEDCNGMNFTRRCNDGISAFELITHLESVKLDLLMQVNCELAKRAQRTIITRTIKETGQ
jgi:hypothetical protein